MLYGRRLLKLEKVHIKNEHENQNAKKYFANKYNWFLFVVIIGSGLILQIPTFYFIQQNYNIFSGLAFQNQPDVLNHLNTEVVWLKTFLFFSLITFIGISFFISRHLYFYILKPSLVIENNLKNLMQYPGQDPVQILPANHDLKHLDEAYQELIISIRQDLLKDIEFLEKINPNIENRQLYGEWLKNIQIKKSKLGLPFQKIISLNVATENESEPKRLAS